MARAGAPDDNNIICVGADPDDMALAINEVIRAGGGQAAVRDGEVLALLGLPIGGIVADLRPEKMAEEEQRLDDVARELGCRLPSPFKYLIFLPTTAIPDYAITGLGLVDCVKLEVIELVLGAREAGAEGCMPTVETRLGTKATGKGRTSDGGA
jgi:adenine deaminase